MSCARNHVRIVRNSFCTDEDPCQCQVIYIFTHTRAFINFLRLFAVRSKLFYTQFSSNKTCYCYNHHSFCSIKNCAVRVMWITFSTAIVVKFLENICAFVYLPDTFQRYIPAARWETPCYAVARCRTNHRHRSAGRHR